MSTASNIYDPPTSLTKRAHIKSLTEYQELHTESLNNNDAFWDKKGKEYVDWFSPYTEVSRGNFEKGDIAWYLNGKLNVSFNCIDRHIAAGKANDNAIIFEGDEPGDVQHITYQKLLEETCRVANAMKAHGVRKGDTVCIYMPMVPEIAYVMLACARIGAPHSVVFAGFSAEALRDRILDANSKWVFTTNEGKRGGKTLKLKSIVDDACDAAPCVERVFSFSRTDTVVPMKPGRDVDMTKEVMNHRPYCPAEVMDSEDTLFLLYTSGSTGKPKGVVHTTAGYLVWTSMTHKLVFDYQPGDVYACVADCGWITGHSYILYGPLSNGATTLMFESSPLYPNPGRYWDMVERHKITQFYTAPTAIRALMAHTLDHVNKYDLSSLKVLGSVGEPINPEAWRWYHENIGKKKCAIVDTYWQTETGGIIVTPLPGATPTKPGAATFPMLGIELKILDPATGDVVEGNDVSGVLVVTKPWPGITRTVYNNHERYLNVYMRPYPGKYFTGDGCTRDKDGYYFITGRVDDVMNVSGHRLGSAEIESALVAHEYCAEAAVIGFPHAIKGTGICAYVSPVLSVDVAEEDMISALRLAVRGGIGPIATPDMIVITPGLPKTRSGKIMRRLLRKIASGESDSLGDISTLADSSVVSKLIEKVNTLLK